MHEISKLNVHSYFGYNKVQNQ